MPPKQQKVSKEKVKKVVEDKTFGLKNKNKSKKVQQYVQTVEANAALIGRNHKDAKREDAARAAKLEAKKAAEQAKREAAELFKTVVKETKVPFGVDPKSVVCEFFKAGQCTKGSKCKFSHDLGTGMKSAKIDLYNDPRQLEAETDTMDKWDTDKLNEVVTKKAAGRMPPTDIVCKYFLDALEQHKYGWLWECPNGLSCHYRHALPPGFVLKPKVKPGEPKDEDDDGPTLEELIEEERSKLTLSKCTPLTFELFQKWKVEKTAKKAAEVEKKRVEASRKTGTQGLHVMSGRDLFRFDPSLFVDDAAADDEQYVIESDDDDEPDAKPLYDRDAQDEDEDADSEYEDTDEERKEKSAADVNAVAAAIDTDLFLDDDEDLPSDDDDDDDDDDDEKKS